MCMVLLHEVRDACVMRACCVGSCVLRSCVYIAVVSYEVMFVNGIIETCVEGVM